MSISAKVKMLSIIDTDAKGLGTLGTKLLIFDRSSKPLSQAQDDAMIQLDGNGTHIVTHGNEALRIEIRDSLLECVSQF